MMTHRLNHLMVIDERLESYVTFFDHDWARNIMALAAGTKLDDSVFNLCINWKAAANTHILPWLDVTGMSSFANGMKKAHEPFGVVLINALAQRLPAKMGDSLRNMQRKKLVQAIQQIGNEVCVALQQARDQDEVDSELFWRMYLDAPESHEFRLAIWGSQRICYGAIYHAYEDFVRECIRFALGRTKYKPHGGIKAIIADAGQHFGPQLADDCLNAPEVKNARLVRNALAHNGGKETDELKKVQHGIRVEDGVLQIMAPDNRSLFSVLKERAYRMAEKAITLPNMK